MRQRPPLRWRARALLGAQRAWRSVGDTLSLTISADSDVAFNTIVMDGGGGIDDIDLIISAGSSGDIVDNGVTIVGGAGNDTIDLSLSASTVSTNTVTVDGGAGNDTIDVTLGGENVGRNTLVIDGRAGDDVIDVQVFGGFGGGNSVVVEGGEGNDTITGSFVDDVLSGGLGDDVLEGGFGDDLLLGGPQIGFGVELSGNPDAPTITLTNLALFAQITALAITIGDTAFGFDLVGAASPGTDPGLDLAASLDTGDTADDLVQTDLIEWSFTGFDGGDSLSFTAEIDPDGASGEALDADVEGPIDDAVVLHAILEGIGAVGEDREFSPHPRLGIIHQVAAGAAEGVFAVLLDDFGDARFAQVDRADQRPEVAVVLSRRADIGQHDLPYVVNVLAAALDLDRRHPQALVKDLGGLAGETAGDRAAGLGNVSDGDGVAH